MYEVTTVTKTLATKVDLDTALAVAETASKTFSYVEVKEIVTTAPWYAKSVKVLTK